MEGKTNKKSKILLVIIGILALLLACACVVIGIKHSSRTSGKNPVASEVDNSKAAPTIELNYNNVSVGLDYSFTAQAKVIYQGEEVEDEITYTWELEDECSDKIASIKPNNDRAVITGLEYGETAFKVSAEYKNTVMVKKLTVNVTDISVMFDSPNMELSAGCYEVNLGLLETETDITSLTPEIYVYDDEKLVENPKFTWTNSDETIAVRDDNGKITAKKAGTTYITGLYNDSKLLIKVNVYRTKIAKAPTFIEAMNGNSLSLSYLKGMTVEDVFFNGKSVLHSYKNGTVKLDPEKLPELGTRGELTIQTDKAEYIMEATVVTKAIRSEADLNRLASYVKSNKGKGYYALANDIKCKGTYDSGSDVEFNGTFDGCGHAIYNMTTADRAGADRGLLGAVMGADGVIKNVSFVGAKHSGQGGFLVKTANGLMENIYIQIDVTDVTTEEWDGATSVLASVTTGAFTVKNVLVEYTTPLPADAKTGYAVWPFYYGYAKYNGLFVVGTNQVGAKYEDLKGGLKDIYGAYMNYGEFMAAGNDVAGWENDFWAVTNGIPYPKNLGSRKAVTPQVKIPSYVGTGSTVPIEGLTIYDRVVVNSTMSKYGIKVKDGALVIPEKVPAGTKLNITVQSAFNASKRVTLSTVVLKSNKISLGTITNVELANVKTFTVDMSSIAKKIGNATLTDVTADGNAFAKASYKNGVLTLDSATLGSLGQKSAQAMFKNGNELIIVDFTIDACTMSIETEEDLNKMASVIKKNNGEGRYVLGADIHCTGTYDSNLEREFVGTFDGQGYAIYNLTTSDRAAGNRGLLGQSLGQAGVVRNVSFVGANHSGMGGFIVTSASGLMENLYIQIDITNPAVGSYDAATSVLASGTFGVFTTSNILIEYPNKLPANAPNGYGVWQLHYGYAKHQGLYAVGANRVYNQKNDLGAGLQDVYGAFKTYADVKLSWNNDFWATKNGIPYPKHLGAPVGEVPGVAMPKYVGPNTSVDLGGLTIYDKVVLDSSMTKLGVKVQDGKLIIPKNVPLGTTIKVTVQSVFDSTKKETLTAQVLSAKNVTLNGTFDAAIYNNETFQIDFGAQASEVAGKTFVGASIDGTEFTTATFENDVLALDTATLSELGAKKIVAQFKNDSQLVNVTINVDVCTMSIKTEADLNGMAAVIEAEGGEGRYVLAGDITCTETYNAGITTPFVGTFDGKGYAIYNLQTSSDESDTRGFFGQNFGKTADGSTPAGVMKNVSFINAKHGGQGGLIAANGSGTLQNVYVQITVSNCNANTYQWATAALVASISPAMTTENVLVEYKEPLPNGATTGYPFWNAYTDFTRHTGLYAVGVKSLYAKADELGTGQTNEWGAYNNYGKFVDGTDLAWENDFWTTTNGVPYPKNLPARQAVEPAVTIPTIASPGTKVAIEGATMFDRVVLSQAMKDLGVTETDYVISIPNSVPAGTTVKVEVQSALDSRKKTVLTTKVLATKTLTLEGIFNAVTHNKTSFDVPFGNLSSEVANAELISATIDGKAFSNIGYANGTLTLDTATLSELGEQAVTAMFQDDSSLITVNITIDACTYAIATEADLNGMAAVIVANNGEGRYILTDNIVCEGTYNSNLTTIFTGTFDGHGYAIYNMQTETATPGTAADTHTRGFFGLQFGNSTDGSTPIGVMKNVSFINAKHNGMGGFIAAKGSGKMENVYIQLTMSDLRGNASGSYEYTTTSLVASPTTAFMTNKVLVEYKEPLASTAVVGYPFWSTYTDFTRHDGLYAVGATKIYTKGDTLGYGQPNEWGAYADYNALQNGTDLAWENDFWTTTNGIPYPKNLPAREASVPNANMVEIATAGMKVPITGLTIFDRVVLDTDMINLGVTVVGNTIQIPELVRPGTQITVKVQSVLDETKVQTLTTKVLGSKNVTLEGHYAAAVYNKTSFDIPVGEALAAEIGNGIVLSAITEGKSFTSKSYADGKITLDTATVNELGDKTVTVMLQGVDNIITVAVSVDVCTYAIASEADLNGMAAAIQANNGQGRYILTNHIFCEGKYNSNLTTIFTGTFDGHGYAIYNMQTETATPGTVADTHTRGFFGLQFGNSTDGSTPIGEMKNVSFINAKHNGMGGFIAAKGSGKMENVYIQLTISDLRGNDSGSYEYTTTSLIASPTTAFMTSKVLVEYKEPLASTAVVGYPFWATYTDFTRHDGLYVVGAEKLYTIGNTLGYGQSNVWGAYADYNALKADVALDWNNDFWITTEGIPTPKKQAKFITMEGILDVGLNQTEFTVDLSGKASELTDATLQSVKVDGAAFAQQKFENNVLTLDTATLGAMGSKTLVATFLQKDGNTLLITQNLNACTMVITSEADLNAMPQVIVANGGDGMYVLGSDITCTGTYNANINIAFIGTFDGKGHVIKNMQTETATPGTAADTHTRGFFGLQFGNSTDGSTPIGVMKNVSFINAKHNGMGGFIAAKGSGKMENVYVQLTISDLRGNDSGSYEYTTTSLVASPSTAFMTNKVLVEYKEPLASTAVVGYPFWATYTDFTRHDGLYVVGATKLYTIGNTLGYGQPNEWAAYADYDALKAGVTLTWENDFWTMKNGVPTPKNLNK